MTAYYNESDRYAAQWLRNLIAAGHIAPGDVDQRSITDVRADDVRGYTQAHFFAGIGGWSYALRLAGWPDSRSVWSGSCPCQPFSIAARQRAPAADKRHLWPTWFSLIAQCRPAIIFGEQVDSAIGWGWLDLVFANLESESYACGATVLPACSVGAPHIRHRLFWLGHAIGSRLSPREPSELSRPQEPSQRRAIEQSSSALWANAEWLPCTDGKARPVEPGTFPLADGIPHRVGRLRAYGNAVLPQLAAQFIIAATGID